MQTQTKAVKGNERFTVGIMDLEDDEGLSDGGRG